MQRVAHAGPWRWILRRHEAILSRRAGTVRNAFEDFDALDLFPADLTERGFRDHGAGRILGPSRIADQDGGCRCDGQQRRLF